MKFSCSYSNCITLRSEWQAFLTHYTVVLYQLGQRSLYESKCGNKIEIAAFGSRIISHRKTAFAWLALYLS